MSLLLEQCQILDNGQTKGLEDLTVHISKMRDTSAFSVDSQRRLNLYSPLNEELRFSSLDSESPVAAEWTRLMMPYSTS